MSKNKTKAEIEAEAAAKLALGSIHYERVDFRPWEGDQDKPDEYTFAGWFTGELVCEGVLPGGGDAVIGVRDVRVTVFHNEHNDAVALQFPVKKFKVKDEDRTASIVRMNPATYAWFKKTLPELPEVARHLKSIYRK